MARPFCACTPARKEWKVTAQSDVTDSRLYLLLMFMWYRVLQAEEDAAAAAIAAAS